MSFKKQETISQIQKKQRLATGLNSEKTLICDKQYRLKNEITYYVIPLRSVHER